MMYVYIENAALLRGTYLSDAGVSASTANMCFRWGTIGLGADLHESNISSV